MLTLEPTTPPLPEAVATCLRLLPLGIFPGVVVVRVQLPGQLQLSEVAQTDRRLAFGFGLRQRRQEHRREDRDDGNHHQQFDERETDSQSNRVASVMFSHGFHLIRSLPQETEELGGFGDVGCAKELDVVGKGDRFCRQPRAGQSGGAQQLAGNARRTMSLQFQSGHPP